MGPSLTGTGCLGLSLSATVITAGVITLLESAAWMGLSLAAYLTYECSYSMPGDLSLNLRMAYVMYFLNPVCWGDNLDGLTPPGQSKALEVTGDGVVSTAYRTSLFSIGYAVLSAMWLCTSLLLLVAVTRSAPGRRAAHLCAPWLLLTAVTMVVDLVATGFYAVDAAGFNLPEDLRTHSNLVVPSEWFDNKTGQDLPLHTGAIIICAVAAKGGFLWLLNGVLLVHVARAVRLLSRARRRGAEKGRPAPQADTAGDGQRHRGPGPMADVEKPATEVAPEVAPMVVPVRSRPVYLPGEMSVPVSPSNQRRSSSQRSLTPPPLSPTRVGQGRLAERPVERPIERPVERPVERPGERPVERPGERPVERSLPHERQVEQLDRPVEILGQEKPAATREEILHRIERMSVLRTSGRSETHGVSPAIEAKTREIMKGLAASGSGIPLDYVFPGDEPRRPNSRGAQGAHHYDGRNNSADLDPPRLARELQRRDTELASPRWLGQQQQQPLPRPRRLDRTQSDRALVAGEWKMTPAGHLHGLSPRHAAAGRRLEATEELKREKPWSYLRAAATAQEEPDEDVFVDDAYPGQHSPNKVVRNMYLPPTARDAVGRKASHGGRRRKQQPMEGDMY
ncbi:uncharacterized protein LOC113217988 isoform X3 [Frankliniella occidentalis]|uniref:Uncharacterized protein LOC113217988 isoform X3 n=1 Tax=Frankliniella occidentalis TaxID=133901 RepID=A0A9C6XU07_FRAOC|nr:uncharacterized protein LOC113217988 isoform X3 [Frankliniella occidentalis]